MEHTVTAPVDGVVTEIDVTVSQPGRPRCGARGRRSRSRRDSTPSDYEVRNGVAWLTINRPEAHNALSKAVRDGLFAGVRRFNGDDDATVLVLTGAGDKAFCAGGDLKEMADTLAEGAAADFVPQFGRNIEVTKPTIAAVNGVACRRLPARPDLRTSCIAADTPEFAISEVKVGRGSPWAAPLPWMIPPRVAMEILLTGDPITAERAREVGLVNDVVPAEDLSMN